MDIEEKKFLAEWMGWRIIEDYGCGSIQICKKQSVGEANIDKDYLTINEWNPDTDHKQFAEVWNALSTYQQKEVYPLLHVFYQENDIPVTYFTNLLLNELAQVMQAVLKVLNEGK